MTMIRLWRTGDRTVDNILLRGVWDKYYYDLLHKCFKLRHKLRAWCETREKQLKDPVYIEEQYQKQMKAEEEKRLA
jgi:hypothetical protein